MLQAKQVLDNRYQLQQQLGHHAGRQTWLAADIDTSPTELVIVKLLAFNPQMQWDEFKLFEREAQVLQQLNHPRIPRYRDYFSMDKEMGGGLFWFGLVQQYIPGASVRQLLNQGKHFTETAVKKIAIDILEILIYLHNLNPPVLHRDIKPSNLILGDNGRIYLVDFGAVQDSAATEGVTFTVVGTSGYAPLEQFWGRAVAASDLYALGATLIHLLTGISPAELPQQDLQIQFRDRISLSANFTRWVEVLTAPDVEQRFNNASEALEALHTNRYPKIAISTIYKPAGSRVKLKKSANELLIKIPSKRRSFLDILKLSGNLILVVWSIPFLLLLTCIILGLGVSLFGLLIFGIPSQDFSNLPVVLLYSVFIYLLIRFLRWLWIASSQELKTIENEVGQAVSHLFGQYCLDFNKKHFVIERQLLSRSYLRQVEELSAIKYFKQIPFKKLTIHTRRLTYSFGQDLTETERDWLFQEIQNWLNDKE